jgi:hypothetical protein
MPTVPHLRLADDFFLLAHDDYTGKPLLNRDVMGLGLAGALLAQLLTERRIVVNDDGVYLHDERTYRDAPTDFVIAEIYSQTKRGLVYPAVEWVKYLRDHTYEVMGDDLVQRRVVREETSGLRRAKRFLANDVLVASAPRVKLAYLCEHPDQASTRLDEQTAALAGLALATKLASAVATDAGTDLSRGLRWMVTRLPADTRVVLASVDAAVVSNALSVRGR